jgi:hypothetical protein
MTVLPTDVLMLNRSYIPQARQHWHRNSVTQYYNAILKIGTLCAIMEILFDPIVIAYLLTMVS